MKKYISKLAKVLLVSALCPLMQSCFNLDEEWYSEVTPDTFFKTKENIYSIANRPFTHGFWYEGIDRWYLQEYTADQMIQPQRGNDWFDGGIFFRLQYHTWTPDDAHIWQAWRGTGMGISLAMECKKDLEGLNYEEFGLTEADKQDHLNQMNAMMGYFYLRALDYFGAFPIVEDPLDEVEARSTDAKVFAKTEALLKEALQNTYVSTAGNPITYQISQGAAATLLARLYFNAEAYIGVDMYEEAAKLCEDIIDGDYGDYSLGKTWYDCFSLTNEDSKAVIWSYPSEMNYIENNWWFKYTHHKNMVQYFGVDNVSAYNGHGLTPSRRPDGTLYTEWKLGGTYEKFNDADLRKKQYVYKGGTEYEGMFLVGDQKMPNGTVIKGNKEYSGKQLSFVDYVGLVSSGGDPSQLSSTMSDGEENSCIRPVKIPIASDAAYRWSSDMVILRLEEVYYMLAECKFRAGDKAGAAELINKVRRRAFEGYNDPDPVTAANLDKYRLVDEWGIEFLCEGRRRTDLIRWDMFVTEDWWDHEASNDRSRHRFPVPTKAISGNNNLAKDPM